MGMWLGYDPTHTFVVNVPGMDDVPENAEESVQQVEIGADFILFKTFDSPLQGKWPRFRGADADNIVKDDVALIQTFGQQGPGIIWERTLGEGHAAPAILNGRVFLLDYMEAEKKEALRCFSLETGEEIWRRSHDLHIKRNHGMSRTIPAVTEDYVVTIGPLGHVMCADPKTGDLYWTIDMVRDYGAEIPFWYTGQCPLIDQDIAVLATGGKSILVGIDCRSGEVVWECPNPGDYQMSHSSVIPMNIQGIPMYVYAGIGGIVGVSARTADRGTLLWETNAFDPTVIAPSPVKLGSGEILVSAGYGAGSIILSIKQDMQVEIIDRYTPREGLASEQQTPIVHSGRIYGILPKDAGQLRNQFVCYSTDDLRNPLWTGGKELRFGLGPYILADGKFFILSDDGMLFISKAHGNGLEILSQYQVMDGNDAWGPMAVADGKLLIRDSKKMVCLDIRA
jgi:outer membrane protein assembly factor BamB